MLPANLTLTAFSRNFVILRMLSNHLKNNLPIIRSPSQINYKLPAKLNPHRFLEELHQIKDASNHLKKKTCCFPSS